MKIYFAGSGDFKGAIEHAKSFLVSYYDLKQPEKLFKFLKEFPINDLFLDSGAFSAFTQNAQIDIDNYINFIKKTETKLSVYANLDVIGEYETTYKNWIYMKENGVSPLPVIHYGAPRSFFDLYFKKHKVSYLALGGLVPYVKRKHKIRAWLDNCFCILKDYWPVKIHLFGVTTQWILERYPAYSCDSTGWISGSRHRSLSIWSKNRIIRGESFNKRTHSHNTNNLIYDLRATNKHYRELQVNSLLAFVELEKYITKLWEEKGVVWKD
jgi:hypothetical protein